MPAIVVGYKAYDSIKNYYENKGKKNVTSFKNHKILKLMGISPFEYAQHENNVCSDTFKLGSDVTHWLLKSPTTKNFNIKGYYDENFNEVETLNLDKGNFYIALDKEGVCVILEVEILGFINNKLLVINSNMWYNSNGYEIFSSIKKSIILDFVNNFNTKENTIIYNPNGIDVRPKIKVDYEINQFDVYALAKEIRSVIEKKRKRGYIFAGVPGTGKSSILLKLESMLIDYPILYVSKSSVNYGGDLNEIFSLINILSPCIVIFEDLDCFGFTSKNNKFFNEFLQEIDGIYEKYNTVIIATLNDSGQVHESLINRPGRFDQVFLINPPETKEEVYTVMKSRYFKASGKILNAIESFSVDILNEIVDNKFTQADVCEIVEKIIISDKEFTNESLEFSIKELQSSKTAIKLCDFSAKEKDLDDADECSPLKNW